MYNIAQDIKQPYFATQNSHHLPIIGYHHSPMLNKFGIPRQPNLVAIKSCIHMVSPFDNPEAFFGIEQYSHLWILWQFHQNKMQKNFQPKVRPPRLGGNDKMGVFATRSMYRPSQIGLSVVQLDKIEVINNKVIVHIIGADMIDKTPILDIKPYIAFADSIDYANSGYMQKPTTKKVKLNPNINKIIQECLDNDYLLNEDIEIIKKLITQDPRPAYRQNEINHHYFMRYKQVDVVFFMNEFHEMIIDNVIILNQFE